MSRKTPMSCLVKLTFSDGPRISGRLLISFGSLFTSIVARHNAVSDPVAIHIDANARRLAKRSTARSKEMIS
jgi:hypothetical protein